jgi:hypothetical protein
MDNRPDIRIPRPPGGNRPGPGPSSQAATARPVTVGDIYSQVAKPDLDKISNQIQQLQTQLDRRTMAVFVGLALLLLGATLGTWQDLNQIHRQLPNQPEHRP